MATPSMQHTPETIGARRQPQSAQSTDRTADRRTGDTPLRGQGTLARGETRASVAQAAGTNGDIVLAARSAVPVLVTAATSAERLACARLIHRTSAQQTFPFVAVSCDASRQPGEPWNGTLSGTPHNGHAADLRQWLARAQGGTLFIDNLEQMSQGWQHQLATALEDGAAPHLQGSPPRPRTTRLITGARFSWCAQRDVPAWNASLFYRLNIIRVDGRGRAEPRRGSVP